MDSTLEVILRGSAKPNWKYNRLSIEWNLSNTCATYVMGLSPGAAVDTSLSIASDALPRHGTHPAEEDSMMVIPRERRRLLLDMFGEFGVSAVFAGHWHENNYASHGDIELVRSGPVEVPLEDDPSGLRVVRVYDDRIEHSYHGLDDVPTGSGRRTAVLAALVELPTFCRQTCRHEVAQGSMYRDD